MSYRGREIEVKLVVYDRGLSEVSGILHNLLGSGVHSKVSGSSTDIYWGIKDEEVRADFVRIRTLEDGTTQLTVKGKDRGSNENRLEIDIETETPRGTIQAFCRALAGKPLGTISKQYVVFWPTENEHENVSCYVVTHPGLLFSVYVEIEATSVESMEEMEAKVRAEFLRLGIVCERESRSLYEIYIEGETK